VLPGAFHSINIENIKIKKTVSSKEISHLGKGKEVMLYTKAQRDNQSSISKVK